jgi:outer membrane protein assembly factor BamA
MLFVLLLNACSSVKYLPGNSYLLTKVQVETTKSELAKSEIRTYLRTIPNSRILGFWRLHLGLYNMSGADTTKGFNRLLRRMGEPPVVFDSLLVESSIGQVNRLFQNKGYFLGTISDSIIYQNNRKVRLLYSIKPGKRYRINHTAFSISDSTINHIVAPDSLKTYLKQGRPFDSEIFNQERDRITNQLRNAGYFDFTKDYISFRVDSALGNYSINDTVVLRHINEEKQVIEHRKYVYRNVYYIISRNPQKALLDPDENDTKFDTLIYKNSFFLFDGKIELHPTVLINSSYVNPGESYNGSLVEKTRLLLSSLGYFRYVDIRFKDSSAPSDSLGQLDCFVQLIPATKQFYSVEVEGTNSSGNLGVGGSVKFQNRNLFHGAEVLDLGVRASTERQMARGTTKEEFRTFEFGANAGIEFPKFLVPFSIEGFRKKYNPRTSVQLYYNYQRRPDYTRTIANIRYGYNWRSSKYINHYLYPAEINFVWLPRVDPTFWSEIENTFLKNSYENHFVLNTNYSLIYNTQLRPQQTEFFYGKFNAEVAGNLLHAVVPMWKEPVEGDSYEVMGVQFAQYAKGEFEFRYHHAINKMNAFAYRFLAGAAYPYGNSSVLPFEKQYFAGGANGIRAWPVRGLGPGTFVDTVLTYYNQMADIKLEANVEYRFKLVWLFEGALFVDAGNIWSIRADAAPEGGLFKWDQFYKQIAVGTGVGLRSDFDYFIFRVDMGVKALDPTRPPGQQFMLGSEAMKWQNLTFNFAIGYPF